MIMHFLTCYTTTLLVTLLSRKQCLKCPLLALTPTDIALGKLPHYSRWACDLARPTLVLVNILACPDQVHFLL